MWPTGDMADVNKITKKSSSMQERARIPLKMLVANVFNFMLNDLVEVIMVLQLSLIHI